MKFRYRDKDLLISIKRSHTLFFVQTFLVIWGKINLPRAIRTIKIN